MISRVDELVYAGSCYGGSGEAIWTPPSLPPFLPHSYPPSLLNKYASCPTLTLPVTVLFDINLGLLCGLHMDQQHPRILF